MPLYLDYDLGAPQDVDDQEYSSEDFIHSSEQGNLQHTVTLYQIESFNQNALQLYLL